MTTETCTDKRAAQEASYVLWVNLPGEPDRDLGPNGRVHWGTKAKLVKQARHDAKYALLGQTTPEERARLAAYPVITLHVYAPRRRVELRMDDDNVFGCLKAARDQIAETLGVNDRIMRCGTVSWTGNKHETVIVLAGETPTVEETK